MLLSNYSSNPYDTTRPKSFFGDRKRLMNEEISQGNGGKSFNPGWNANKKSSQKATKKDSGHTKLISVSTLSVYVSVIIASLIWVS